MTESLGCIIVSTKQAKTRLQTLLLLLTAQAPNKQSGRIEKRVNVDALKVKGQSQWGEIGTNVQQSLKLDDAS